MINTKFWQNKKVFITGHTGFKGAWLAIWLQQMGASVLGYALKPKTTPNLYTITNLTDDMESIIGDIRDADKLTSALKQFKPDIIFHLAAQPLVRESFINPVETYSTNIIGTLNLLEAARYLENTRVLINVTTDKCYENKGTTYKYQESDPLGGFDPYSSSKACSELISSTYKNSFYKHLQLALATARAGNVIGGGDWTKDRIIPDCIHSFETNKPLCLRYPNAIRPWQHVLSPLSGYMLLAEKLFENKTEYEGAWNFGPVENEFSTVAEIVETLCKLWPFEAGYSIEAQPDYHEEAILMLDSTKALKELGWHSNWKLYDALKYTLDWYKRYANNENMHDVCIQQIKTYQTSVSGVSKA